MFMNNFTKCKGRSFWHAITNSICCSIGLANWKSFSIKSIMTIMLFAFTVAPMFGQQVQNRTIDINGCIGEAVEGL